MFRTVRRLFLPNPLDWMLKRIAAKGGRKILLGWNRGLGDIPLGLYAIVQRIRKYIPHAEITFLTRENLREGFSMLEGVGFLIDPTWKRGQPYSVRRSLKRLGIDPKAFDLVIERPSPNDWVRWQRGTLTPHLKWDASCDALCKPFDLPPGFTYIGVQLCAETDHGAWRNWPLKRWDELLRRLAKMPHVKVLLFGYGVEPQIPYANVIDLRGKTTLCELLSVIKNRCRAVVLPDSGILSMLYYLDTEFPIQVISLWTDCEGVLKQGVFSPNKQLIHRPLIGQRRDPTTLVSQRVIQELFPVKALSKCRNAEDAVSRPVENVGVVLLAGGQGSRLGFTGPKGLFSIQGRSLFQRICEKVETQVPIAVMTSPLNHEATISFFERHRFFGKEVHFFQQGLLPMRDRKGRELDLLGPDGNGTVFKAFEQSGLCGLFKERGIDLVSIIPIENPLVSPLDPALIGWARETGADATLKCMEWQAGEKTGVLVEREERIEVIEYTELDAQTPYKYAYTGMMALLLSFMERMAAIDLPLHWVWKQTKTSRGKEIFAWKGERFIFDALPLADQVEALCFPRDQIYAPLKSLENLQQIEKRLGVVQQ